MELHSMENENENKYSFCKVYIVLMISVFTIFIGITIYFVYYNWFLIKIMFLALNLKLTEKQKIGRLNFIECNFIEHINERQKTNKY